MQGYVKTGSGRAKIQLNVISNFLCTAAPKFGGVIAVYYIFYVISLVSTHVGGGF